MIHHTRNPTKRKSLSKRKNPSKAPADPPNGLPSALPSARSTEEVAVASPGLGSASDATLDTAAEQAGTKYGPPAWRIRLWREVAAEHPRIQVDPAVMGGEPVIVGTRIPVYVILGYATEFESHEQLAAQFYNEISAADVKAALIFASSLCW